MPTARTRFGAPVTQSKPVVTYTILALCILVYVGQRTIPGLTGELSFRGIFAGSEPWRFVTSAFVHSPSGLLHIFFNMYILYAFGPMLEQLLGRAKFLVIYLLCAIGGSVGVLWFSALQPGWLINVVGASGAIFGLLLLYVVLVLRSGHVPTSLLVMIGINLALPFFIPNIAWQAHIGGALVGAAIGGLLVLTSASGRSPDAVRRRKFIWPALAGVALLLAVLAVVRILQVLGPAAFSL